MKMKDRKKRKKSLKFHTFSILLINYSKEKVNRNNIGAKSFLKLCQCKILSYNQTLFKFKNKNKNINSLNHMKSEKKKLKIFKIKYFSYSTFNYSKKK